MTARVLVCGDRDWDDEWIVRSVVWGVCCSGHDEPCTTVIEGDARGADRMAGKACDGYEDLELLVFPAEWDKHGRAGGPIRNQRMLDEGKPEAVVAFHDDITSSKGTLDMCRRAAKAGLPVYVVSRFPGSSAEQPVTATDTLRILREQRDQASASFEEAIVAAHDEGTPVTTIATQSDLSRQAVYDLLKRRSQV